MENPNWSISEIDSDEEIDDEFNNNNNNKSKLRGKNAKQLTWVLLLKAHRAAGCLSSLAATVRRRIKSSATVRRRFDTVIRGFFAVSLILLCVELAAYFKGPFGVWDLFDRVYGKWVLVRVGCLAPSLQWLANVCIILFLVQTMDRLILCLGCFWIRLKGIKPVPKMGIDLEAGDGDGYFPMVLVQIPMCNEREVKILSMIFVLSFVILI